MPKNFSLKIDVFPDGTYGAPLFFEDDGLDIGSGLVTIKNGEPSVVIQLNAEGAKKLGIDLDIFHSELMSGSQMKIVAKHTTDLGYLNNEAKKAMLRYVKEQLGEE